MGTPEDIKQAQTNAIKRLATFLSPEELHQYNLHKAKQSQIKRESQAKKNLQKDPRYQSILSDLRKAKESYHKVKIRRTDLQYQKAQMVEVEADRIRAEEATN